MRKCENKLLLLLLVGFLRLNRLPAPTLSKALLAKRSRMTTNGQSAVGLIIDSCLWVICGPLRMFLLVFYFAAYHQKIIICNNIQTAREH